MRYLGIDYGKKRIGLALSDEGGTIAFPREVISNDVKTLARIAKICQDEKVGVIVLGESRDFQGAKNKIMEMIEPFKIELWQETGLPVEYELEFLTSQQVEKTFGKNAMLDASAATIILQAFLEKMKSNVNCKDPRKME